MEFKLSNGKKIEFEKFTPKQSNLIKVRLHNNDNDTEGIWACVSDKDFEDIQNNVSDSGPTRIANLRNSALMFYPNNSWGWYIPIQLNGSNRADCDVRWIETEQDPLSDLTETVE